MKFSNPEDDREFDSLLAAFSERELTSWEQDRLWTLLKNCPERVEEWKRQCRVVALLEGLDEGALAEEGIAVSPTNVVPLPAACDEKVKRRLPMRWISGAAVVAMIGIVAFLFSGPKSPEQTTTPVVAAARPEKLEPRETESIQEKYERTVAALPMTASKQRPPTSFASLSKTPDESVDFNNDIRPILADKCYHCHGPDEKSRKADLRLDMEEGAFADLDGHFAFVAGDAEKSEAVIRIYEEDPDSVMPPPDFHKELSDWEKAKIVQWIEAGAEWEGHWSFEKPERPKLPADVKGDPWVRNEIDAFVLRKLKEKGLSPNKDADRYILARRAALDITGLPPTPEELKAFVEDESEDAYEKYVDRLLASPHYGEHRARFWLDAARYGDTHGLHLDNYREMWPWRDWVIQAFNENMPFDEFAREQIAGDLMPNATRDQRIATGFSRCNVSSSEGGSIPEELAVRYMVDRVETTATVFLGLTAGCAVCHDHKYDPISQKDFYSLAAFFNNNADPAMDGNQKDTPPVVVLPEGEMAIEWSGLMKRRAELRVEMAKERASAVPAKQIGAHPVGDDALRLWMPMDEMGDEALAVWVDGKEQEIPLPEKVNRIKDSPVGPGIVFEEGGAVAIPNPGMFNPDRAFSISFWVRTPDEVRSSTLMQQLAKAGKDGKKQSGFKLTQSVQGGTQFEFCGGDDGLVRSLLPGEEALDPNKWQHLLIRYSGGRSESALEFLVNGKRRPLRPGTEDLIDFDFEGDAPLQLGTSFKSGGMSQLRIFDRWMTDEEARLLASENVLRKPDAPESLKKLYAAVADDPDYRDLSREFAHTQCRRDYIAFRSPTTMVMQERTDSEPEAFVLERGEYDKKGEKVKPAVPAVLPPMPKGAPRNRLGLAEWITMPSHPLTARVTVNRLWQQTFGRGLVLTAEDFGTMGEKPTHPELLDWLATEFVESGWDVKHMIRLMVTSSAYRQSSVSTEEKIGADSDNRYLSRGPRRRLDAEVIRDQALAVSGLLNEKMGGPSVKPPQPQGLWVVVAQGGSNTKDFQQDTGEDVYRRSVYTYWKKTAPPPPMAIFNAPSRESCTVRRERTNTPLQALVLMNEVQFVEAARELAEMGVRNYPDDRRGRLKDMTLRVTGRPVNPTDLETLQYAASEFREYFDKSPESAKELIATGDSPPDESLNPVELAAWTMVANTLLNRDDVINEN